MTIETVSLDVFNLICDNLDIKELELLSSLNKQLASNVGQLVQDNLSAGNPILPLREMRAIVKEDFKNAELEGIASRLTKERAGVLDASVANTRPTTLHPLSQAKYIYKYNQNYRTLWTALRESLDSLPDLQGSDAIKAWLIDPENRAALGSITTLSIRSPDFLFFPPEVKNKLTALTKLDCSGCTSLKTLDLQDYPALQSLSCRDCTSLQTLNLQHCPKLRSLICRDCTSLQELKLQDYPVLRSLFCSNCSSLQSLDLHNCAALETLYCTGCTSMQTLNLQGCSALVGLYCAVCTSLQALDLQDCSILQTLYCRNCTSLKEIALQGCRMLKELFCRGCILIQYLDLQYCQALQRIERSDSMLYRT